MIINEIGEKECRAILARASMGRLGCSLNDQPYVVPVYFAYESDYFYVFSTLGKKIEWMRTNPKVCVEVDEITNQPYWVSVVANGRYEELPEPQDAEERAHAHKLLAKRQRWWLNALAERRTTTADESIAPVFFRIRIDSMTGLSGLAEGEEAGAVPR
jgi:nitroimidazol reductase NimA-like FMN-containing flavoprotein (pyridoxamine 5'-phosphate oxidase superfamily)